MNTRLAPWVAFAVLLSPASALSQTSGFAAPHDVAFAIEARSEVSHQTPDSAEALQRLLQDALAVARKRDDQKLADLIQEMEIPNYRAWFTATYGPIGSAFADAYGAKLSEQNLARIHMLQATAHWMQLARTKTVLIRRINDAPNMNDPFESNAIKNLQRPVSIFVAYHQASRTQNPNPIGYFVYVDGKFRWQSGFVEDVVTHRIIVNVGQ